MSSALTVCWRVSLPSMSSVARNGSPMVAVSGSDKNPEIILPSPYARCATAACGHQLAITDRPGRRTAHRLLGYSLHWTPVEIGPVLDQLEDVEHRLARGGSNEREKCLRAETVAAIEDSKPHAHSFPVAASSAASAASYWRVACPTAAHTTISKIWSSLTPDTLAALMSSSVTL